MASRGCIAYRLPSLRCRRAPESRRRKKTTVIEVHLYGKLRRYAPASRASGQSVVRLEVQDAETVATVLERLGIPSDDVCHVFLNGAILSTQNSMAPWLKYQQAGGGSVGRPDGTQQLNTHVHSGDRLGIFAHDMALLVV